MINIVILKQYGTPVFWSWRVALILSFGFKFINRNKNTRWLFGSTGRLYGIWTSAGRKMELMKVGFHFCLDQFSSVASAVCYCYIKLNFSSFGHFGADRSTELRKTKSQIFTNSSVSKS